MYNFRSAILRERDADTIAITVLLSDELAIKMVQYDDVVPDGGPEDPSADPKRETANAKAIQSIPMNAAFVKIYSVSENTWKYTVMGEDDDEEPLSIPTEIHTNLIMMEKIAVLPNDTPISAGELKSILAEFIVSLAEARVNRRFYWHDVHYENMIVCVAPARRRYIVNGSIYEFRDRYMLRFIDFENATFGPTDRKDTDLADMATLADIFSLDAVDNDDYPNRFILTPEVRRSPEYKQIWEQWKMGGYLYTLCKDIGNNFGTILSNSAIRAFVANYGVEPEPETKRSCTTCNAKIAQHMCPCKKVAYCGKACQIKHWKTHGKTCKMRLYT